ncbi:MAG: hypothetical protein JWP48_440 [Actinoallomurus sp.]|nr:hypothetical protein [Actinoallomurus sp.]
MSTGVEDFEPEDPARTCSRAGRVSLAAVLLSVALIVVVGVHGPSAAVPPLDHPGWPPVFRSSHPSDVFVTVTLWAAMATGAAGVAGGLWSVRRGWRPSPRRLAVAIVLSVAALVAVPPMGSRDMTDYATYGRIAVLGHNPHVMTPRELRATGDPVARLSSRAWSDSPTVYGPVATATQWAASALGGASTARTTFWLKVWNALAFLATALALDRLVGPDRGRRVRAHLLWSLNPLMLWAGLAGGHADIVGVALMIGSLSALRRSPLAAGFLLGGAVAVKATFAFAGAGLAWALRRSPLRLLAAAVGAFAVLVCGYAVVGPRTLTSLISRSQVAAPDNPWGVVAKSLGQPPSWVWSWGTLTVALLLAALLAWRLPPGPPAVRATLALSLAWLVTTPIYHPWYDALVFPLIALMPASRLDWYVLARGAIAAFGPIPGIFGAIHQPWLRVALRKWITSQLVPGALLVSIVVLVLLCVVGRWNVMAYER